MHLHSHINYPRVLVHYPDSGQTQDSIDFQIYCNIQIDFEITCPECCLKFLLIERGYQLQHGANGCNTRVIYSDQPTIDCFLKGPSKRGKYPRLKAHPDLNIGVPFKRNVSQSHSYQLYAIQDEPQKYPLSPLIIDQVVERLESVAIDALSPQDISGCTLNFCNAALLELYCKKYNKQSFRGIVVIPAQD
ncbi:hypothetical protein CYY_001045 [Polysphondylium violaceum]|uniref:Uncharacterized protein n=1 Tax=Polysphondylium violaceum TaxID=133409 RepID=A0A8J4PYT0_9MYCE|nr:hypothetical protein CYY_001045 [Polysphondylium violaceum]